MSTAGPIVADLRAESDDLDARGRRPARRPLGGRHARAGLDDRPSDRASAVDRSASRCRGHRRGRLHGLCSAAAAEDPTGFVDRGRRGVRCARRPPICWPTGAHRARLHDALLTVADGRKLPWFGPPMSAASMATARLMETWAHGLDVADALGVKRPATARLRSIAHIGVRTRDFAFAINGLAAPADRSASSCVRPTARHGRGGPTTPRSGSPDPRRTSACWLRSGGRGRPWTSTPSVTTSSTGCPLRRRSPARRARVVSEFHKVAPELLPHH